MGKLLGIDYGDKRIGIATSDEKQDYIFPGDTMDNSANIIQKICDFIEKESIEKVIVGFPVNMRGEENAQSEKIKRFADTLGGRIKIPVVLEDERLTSQFAERLLRDIPGRRKPKGNIDRQAAILILESYMGKNKR
ncbi:MAG: Holliday junction resolvase RuvX [Patescibacteria group bacterium]|jgi:putative Holliday junction resolvase